MAQGNKGFGDRLAGGGVQEAPSRSRLPPRTTIGILGARENRLSELAGGVAVTRIHEQVDPARCRIWEGHNRDYAALNETTCADLIESIKAQGKQEIPAIVRRVSNDPGCDFEVICGARRHWTVTWLRSHDFPALKFLVEPRELTDEEAFRVADLENRSRQDLSDYERATDYARAVERYYEGSQQRMADRLDVSLSWLNRYLELARLPPEVVASFGVARAIGSSHAGKLAPVLRLPVTREKVLAAATVLAKEQADLAARGEPFLLPARVTARLLAAAAARERPAPKGQLVVQAQDGTTLVRGTKVRGGGLAITVPALKRDNREAVVAALTDLVEQALAKPGRSGKADR